MWRLLLCLAILRTAYTSCPDGFELVRNGECRGLYATTTDIPENQMGDTPVKKCKEIDALPVIIHDEIDQTYWNGLSKNIDLILGIVCNSTSKQWTWGDGSSIDYKPAAGYDDLNSKCADVCVWEIAYGNGYWLHHCYSKAYTDKVYCKKQVNRIELTDDGCNTFENDDEDGVCYQVGTAAESWQDAQAICLKLGANLASIHNAQENSFIRRLAVSKGAVHGLFIGATASGKGSNYGWIDGSQWDYDNFVPGFPIPGLGDCIAMDTSTPNGQWINVDCTAQLPVACIRPKKPHTEPTCSTDIWKEEGRMITSPGFPYTASTPCNYYLEVDAGKKVEVKIHLLEANSCCDYLVINDGYFGGNVLANLTGAIENVTYTTSTSNIMLVNWVPNGGIKVYGFAMTFRGI